jgi:hypothetical protein
MSYGASLASHYCHAADYVDKVLRGAKPGDIPVEQPTKFDLIVNLKAAKALGLELSPSLLARAEGDRMTMLFAAMHESVHGTKRTSPSSRRMSAFGVIADIP